MWWGALLRAFCTPRWHCAQSFTRPYFDSGVLPDNGVGSRIGRDVGRGEPFGQGLIGAPKRPPMGIEETYPKRMALGLDDPSRFAPSMSIEARLRALDRAALNLVPPSARLHAPSPAASQTGGPMAGEWPASHQAFPASGDVLRNGGGLAALANSASILGPAVVTKGGGGERGAGPMGAEDGCDAGHVHSGGAYEVGTVADALTQPDGFSSHLTNLESLHEPARLHNSVRARQAISSLRPASLPESTAWLRQAVSESSFANVTVAGAVNAMGVMADAMGSAALGSCSGASLSDGHPPPANGQSSIGHANGQSSIGHANGLSSSPAGGGEVWVEGASSESGGATLADIRAEVMSGGWGEGEGAAGRSAGLWEVAGWMQAQASAQQQTAQASAHEAGQALAAMQSRKTALVVGVEPRTVAVDGPELRTVAQSEAGKGEAVKAETTAAADDDAHWREQIGRAAAER